MYVCNIYRDKELELAPKKGVVVGGNRKAERSNSCSTTMLLHAMQFVRLLLLPLFQRWNSFIQRTKSSTKLILCVSNNMFAAALLQYCQIRS